MSVGKNSNSINYKKVTVDFQVDSYKINFLMNIKFKFTVALDFLNHIYFKSITGDIFGIF